MKQNIKNSEIAGVDVATTNSVIAIMDDTGKPKIIPNLDGGMTTPSAIHVGPGGKEILVGTAALNMRMIAPERTITEFKRDVGTDKVYLREGSLEITPEWCQARLLEYLRRSVIQYTGNDRAASFLAVSVPAYFTEKERQSVMRSIELTRARVISLINEPTAAGLAHGIHEKQGDRLVVVVDFGGGTLDVSLISYAGGHATVLASNGDKHLGGTDVDKLLMKQVQQAFKQEHGIEFTARENPGDYYQVHDEIIRQKHLLSARTEVKIIARVNSKQVILPVTRDQLREWTSPLIARVEKIIRETIEMAKVDPAEIKHVIPVGGSSRLVPFQEMLQRLFGRERISGGNISPDLAVAEGAAIHAVKAIADGGQQVVNEALEAIPAPAITHTEVMPHSLGVAVQDQVSSAEHCSVILERNTNIPCKISRRFGSVSDDQTRFKVLVVQGEDRQPIKDCLAVGEKELEFPARPNSKESLELTMGYDASGMVSVQVRDLVSGRTEDITIQYYKKN